MRITELWGKIKQRYLFILAGMILFLPPLSLIPQTIGETNMCGKVCPRLFLILSTKGIAAGALSSVQKMWFGVLLAATVLIVTFFFGRLWCSHLCPIGGATEMIGRFIPERLKINFAKIDAPAFRYGYFAVFVAGAYWGAGNIACKLCNFRIIPFLAGSPFEPAYAAYLSTSMGVAGLLTVSLAGFFAKGGRAYCNCLCPVGAVDGLVNYLSSKLGFTKKMRTDPGKCAGCGQCVASCMVWALKQSEASAAVKRDSLSCISCLECEKTCPHGAIYYGKLKK